MRRVLKWPGRVGDLLLVPAHPDAEIVLVGRGPGMSEGEFGVWVGDDRIDGTAFPEVGWGRVLEVYGTGHAIPEGRVWRGSWIDGDFVWHAFEVTA